jgi:AmiR/NasT family two-component response regulator
MNGSIKDIRVLIAEDDYLVGEMIKGMLADMGYTIVGHAADGIEATRMVESLHPDVIVMDIKMPDMDGIEATYLIHERYPTPVVVLTAFETPELLSQASMAGVGAYLIKPPNPHDIERAITVAMARFKDLIALRRLNAELQERYVERDRLVQELQETLARVKVLSGLLPICASCKKIRDDQGYWNQIEAYLRDHSDVEFSHGLCPDCAKKHYPEYFPGEGDDDED